MKKFVVVLLLVLCFGKVGKTQNQVIEQPFDIHIEGAPGTAVQLVWDESMLMVDSYKVFRSTTQGGPYVLIGSVDGIVTSYLDEGLVKGTTYYYVITQVEFEGESPFSPELVVVLP